jgi:hypothetical protein
MDSVLSLGILDCIVDGSEWFKRMGTRKDAAQETQDTISFSMVSNSKS